MGLTFKQEKFVQTYVLNGGNGTDAARQAGYKGNDKTLSVVAVENLAKPSIKAALDEHRSIALDAFKIAMCKKRKLLWAIAVDRVGDQPMLAVNAIAELNRMDSNYSA